jgi:hypothetical protein
MDLALKTEIAAEPDLRHRIRQLRWFKTSFRHDARLISQRYGFSVEIDDRPLTQAFLDWAEAFESERAHAGLDRRDFVIFAAGLLLRELLRAKPITVAPLAPEANLPATPADASAPIARFWPEGFIYTNYCLCILSAILDQEGMSLSIPALADDLRVWWSYRENAGDDPSQAIPFLDLFTGNEPNWWMPDTVLSRAAMKRAVEAKIIEPAPGKGLLS